PQAIRHPCTKTRPACDALARGHEQAPARVVDIIAHHRANDAQTIGAGTYMREQFAHPKPALAVFGEPRGRPQQASLLTQVWLRLSCGSIYHAGSKIVTRD